MPATYSELEASPLPFLHLIEGLKHLPRTGWMRFIQHPESVAAHSWRVEGLAMFVPDGVDIERCRFLGYVHDIAESVVGDIPKFACMPKERKHKLEDFGIRYIESLLKPSNPILGAKIRAAWEEYEAGDTPDATPEARYIKEFDKLECLIQAYEYELRTHGEQEGLQEFQGLISKIVSKEGKAWVALLQEEREAHFSRLKQRAPIIFIIGASGVGKKTLCDLLSMEFGFPQISLDKVLCEKSQDQTYLHVQYIKDCLAEDVDVATQLAVNLLGKKINEVNTWSLMLGFPERMEQVVEFERMVQKTNYTLLLNWSSSEETPGEALGRSQDMSDVVDHLKRAEGYFKEISSGGSVEEVFPLVKKAVEEFIQHAEAEK